MPFYFQIDTGEAIQPHTTELLDLAHIEHGRNCRLIVVDEDCGGAERCLWGEIGPLHDEPRCTPRMLTQTKHCTTVTRLIFDSIILVGRYTSSDIFNNGTPEQVSEWQR